MPTPKSKTPAWPVDLDLVMRKLRLRRQGSKYCVFALTYALQDAGYPAQALERTTRSIRRDPKIDGSMEINFIREQPQYAVRLGALFLTPAMDTNWEQVLRTVHDPARDGITEDQEWTTEFANRERGITPDEILEHARGDTGEQWIEARARAATMMRDLLAGRPRSDFPAVQPEAIDVSLDAQVRRVLQALRDSGRINLSSNEHTPMGVLAVHLANNLTAQGLPVEAMEYREITKEAGWTFERTDVFLKAPWREPLLLGAPGVGEIRCITEARKGSLATTQVGTSGLRALPEWPTSATLARDIQDGLAVAGAILQQAHLQIGTAPTAASPAARPPRM